MAVGGRVPRHERLNDHEKLAIEKAGAMKLNELLGDPAWLFDFGFPIKEMAGRISKPELLEWKLNEECMIPAFSSLSGTRRFAEAYIGWSPAGFFFQAHLKALGIVIPETKAAPNPARASLFSVYVDTRWSPDVHRATSFCHRFDFIVQRPTRSTPEQRGHGELAPIQRARAAPAEVHPKDISVAGYLLPDGYEVKAFLPADTLTGYSPEEFQDVGVFYTINDLVYGNQIMARTLQSPYFEDPSVWCHGKLQQTST